MSSTNPPTDPPDIPEKTWSNPFAEGTPLHSLYGGIIRQNRDLVIIVDDWHARRGTGKTVASLQLARGMDQTKDGITREKATMSAEELRRAYSSLPKRSAIVFDEGEVGASNRQAMTNSNQALREIVSMGRIEEKYVIINTPSMGFIDKDIRLLADVWITMQRKGKGLVHFLERQPYSGTLMTPKKQTIEFDDIPKGTDLRDVYNHLTRQKQKKIDGDDGDAGYVPEKKHERVVEQARKQARLQSRNETIRQIYREHEDVLSYVSIGDAVELSDSQINNIINEETDS